MYTVYCIIVTFLKVKIDIYNKIVAKITWGDPKKNKSVDLQMNTISRHEQLVFIKTSHHKAWLLLFWVHLNKVDEVEIVKVKFKFQ